MDAQQYKIKYGKKKTEEICKKAGTNYAYFKSIYLGFRHPSPALALKLVRASNNELDFFSLINPKKRKVENNDARD